MAEPFIGEIRMFGGNFAPRGWALCDGQLLAVSQNDALFSLLGTIYGGDGRTTFGLPDMRGRVPVHEGSTPGLTPKRLGQKGGVEAVTLTANEIPQHDHAMSASTDVGSSDSPAGNYVAENSRTRLYRNVSSATAPMAGDFLGNAGGGQPHNNMMPFTCVNYIIALVGVYPSRS